MSAQLPAKRVRKQASDDQRSPELKENGQPRKHTPPIAQNAAQDLKRRQKRGQKLLNPRETGSLGSPTSRREFMLQQQGGAALPPSHSNHHARGRQWQWTEQHAATTWRAAISVGGWALESLWPWT